MAEQHGKFWDAAVTEAIKFLEATSRLNAAKVREEKAYCLLSHAQETHRDTMRSIETAEVERAMIRRSLEGATQDGEEMKDAIQAARMLLAQEKRARRRNRP